MAYTIQIEVDASLKDSDLIHRTLNFKEDIRREFIRSGSATIENTRAVDSALDPLTIFIPSKRLLASVSKCINQALRRNDVSENIHVERVR